MREGGTLSALRGTTIFLWVLPALLLAMSGFLSSRVIRERSVIHWSDNVRGGKGSLFLEISRNPAFAFGFRNFLGDLAWLRAVQIAGTSNIAPGDYDRLYVLLRTVGNFDPRFVVPYILGGMVLGDSPATRPRGARSSPAGDGIPPGRLAFPLLHRLHEILLPW